MRISKYVCLFLIYSFLGWIFESVFCTIKSGRWENRGFLYGPVVPIYGTGAVVISLVVRFCVGRGFVLSPVLIYIISVIGSAILEYVTSWILEKLFHALWWDYSKLPLNINGRISLFTSLGFGFGGLLIVYVIVPFFEGLIGNIFSEVVELLSLCMLFIFAVDITLTVTALYHFDKIVVRAEDSFNQSMSNIVDGAVRRTNSVKQGIVAKGTAITDQANIMSGFAKKAIHRVYAFKDEDKKMEASKNKLLSIIKRSTGKVSDIED